jgi:lipoprotein-anchoring transpeptidase ErfK/SrfK
MNTLLRCAIVAALLSSSIVPAAARKKAGPHKEPVATKQKRSEIEAARRLQVFLDRANFCSGKLDGHYGGLTIKALVLYRQSRGEQPPPPPAKRDTAPDVNGLDFAGVGPVFVPYTVADVDLQNIGPVPSTVREQARLKFLPYRDAGEAIAEKFHCAVQFLEKLNPGKTKTIKVGDQLMVPNVEPFELGAVKDIKPGSEIAPAVANDMPDESDAQNSKPDAQDKPSQPSPPATSVKIDTKTNMLGVFQADKLVAAYPVTIGSAHTASPIGNWKVRGVAKMPRFRYDEQMLKHGLRSGNFHLLPPGPNSPVGVIWIALNKKGIGLHGTNEPETIGHSTSHGCVRLANWDIVRLAQKVKAGVPVFIH